MKSIIEKSVEAGIKSKPQFQSSFKAWIRIAAFIVVAVFLPEQAVQAKSRRDKALDTAGMVMGGFLFATPISGQSFSTFVRNYGLTYGAPKLLSKPLGEIGSQFAVGALMGGFMNGRGGFNFKLALSPMLESGILRATSAAIQELGYKGRWDTKFGGITYFASDVGTNLMDFGLSKVLGGWKISADQLKIEWLGREDVKNYALAVKPFGFQNRWATLISEGISLSVQHLAERSFGLERHPEYSRSITARGIPGAMGGIGEGVSTGLLRREFGFKSLAKTVVNSVAQGLVSAGLQHLTKELAPLGPYMGAMMTWGLSTAIYRSKAKTAYDMQTIIGNFFVPGARLDGRGNLIYPYAFSVASLTAKMVDFSRQARDLPNSAWTHKDWNKYLTTGRTPRTDFFGALANRYFSGIHSQATNNFTDLITNRMGRVKVDGEIEKDIPKREEISPIELQSGVTAKENLKKLYRNNAQIEEIIVGEGDAPGLYYEVITGDQTIYYKLGDSGKLELANVVIRDSQGNYTSIFQGGFASAVMDATGVARTFNEDNRRGDNGLSKEYLLWTVYSRGWIVLNLREKEWNKKFGRNYQFSRVGGIADYQKKIVGLPVGKNREEKEELATLSHETIHVLQASLNKEDLINVYDELVGKVKDKETRDLFDVIREHKTTDYNPPTIRGIKFHNLFNSEKRERAVKAYGIDELFAGIFGKLMLMDESEIRVEGFVNEREIMKATGKYYIMLGLSSRAVKKVIRGLESEPEARKYFMDYYIRLGFDAKIVEKLFLQSLSSTSSSAVISLHPDSYMQRISTEGIGK